jgi:hypothetical protein
LFPFNCLIVTLLLPVLSSFLFPKLAFNLLTQLGPLSRVRTELTFNTKEPAPKSGIQTVQDMKPHYAV